MNGDTAALYSLFLDGFLVDQEDSPGRFILWRDRTGHEVDVILDTWKNLIPLEVKSGETVVSSFFNGLRYFISLGSPALPSGVLIHGGDALYQRENFIVRPWYLCV